MLNKRQSKNVIAPFISQSSRPSSGQRKHLNLSKFAFSEILNLYPHNLRKPDNFIFPQHL